MTDSKNTAIAVLCVSAAILAAVLVLMNVSADRALADASSRGGDYLIASARFTDNTDIVYVLDIAQQKLNAYGSAPRAGTLTLLTQVNLKAK